MSRLLCCLRGRQHDMGAALSHLQEGEASEVAGAPPAPPTMADVIRERKKKAGGAGLGTLRRRIAAAARRPRGDARQDRGGCEHARLVRATVSSWRLAEVFLVCEELEAGAALRDLLTRAELAREPAPALHADLAAARADRLWCDVELVGVGWSIPAHRVILSARCAYFRDLLQRYPPGRCRVVLDGVCATLSRDELVACICALYSGNLSCHLCTTKYERSSGSCEGDLDIINTDNNNSLRRGAACRACGGSGSGDGSGSGRLASLSSALGFSPESLHRDMKYLLDSGELSDTRLVFVSEEGGGFRSALDLTAHRLILASRSRFFRGVLSRRSSSTSTGVGGSALTSVVCVDEKVLPRRFARALLHAAYTDQVDLSLIGRNSSSPSSSNNTTSANTGWVGVSRGSGSGRGSSAAALDDAFALYEIARFLEMPIVVQGCEDAIVEALSPETLPQILRWSAASHASQWVHRQSMRYLRDEFSSIMCTSACGHIPRGALTDALASSYLQASELQALRAILRWAAAQHTQQNHTVPEPNVVWHTAHAQTTGGNAGGGGGVNVTSANNGVVERGVCLRRGGVGAGRRREATEAALRDTLAPLLPLLRIEHLPTDTDLLHQLVRRGILPGQVLERPEAGTADAWLGRGACRPARCFIPYLDEMKALLEDQTVPEAEVARMRRERYLHRIPDTLYMVAAARGAERNGSVGVSVATERCCVSTRTFTSLRIRMRELCNAQPQLRALAIHRADPQPVYTQIALRAVREMSLPDSCAELLLADIDNERERDVDGWHTPPPEQQLMRGEQHPRGDRNETQPDCCRSGSSCSASGCTVGSVGGGSARTPHTHHLNNDNSRPGSCRREMSLRLPETNRSRNRVSVSSGSGGGSGSGSGSGRLSAAVPDVAMAPNANTHLLTSRDYFRHPLHTDYCGVVLQLDLGDGATHTPRPGSRAQRSNALAHTSRLTHHQQGGVSCVRATRQDEDDLRAAIEMSVMRAYSSLEGGGNVTSASASGGGAWRQPRALSCGNSNTLGTLPQRHRSDLQGLVGLRSSAGPTSSVSSGAGGSAATVSMHRDLHTPPLHLTPRARTRHSTATVGGGGDCHSATATVGHSPRRHDYALYEHGRHEYRLEPQYGSSGSTSRGHSPNNYA